MWAYLNHDAIIEKAHKESGYKPAEHGETIISSFDADSVQFSDLDDQSAEQMSDLVDARLQQGLLTTLADAARRPIHAENWRRLYFGTRKEACRTTGRSASGHD